jgi:DnaJ-like protein
VTSHYHVLGVRPTASVETIKRAYYRKARAYHPDAHAGSSSAVLDEAERAMAALNAAWNVLRDPILRAEYDAALVDERRVDAGRRTTGQPRRKPEPPPALLGQGFHYRFGLLGSINRDGEARPRLSLTVDGATDLSPLRSLVPNGLWALHADGARIADAELVNLQGMRTLQVLDLTGTLVTDAGLLHLQDLGALETLLLWDTHVTDAGLAMLGRMSSLRILGLGNTGVTDAGLAHLAGLEHLRVLQLSGTAVEGYGLEHLHGLLDLDIVSLPWRVRGRHRRRLRAALPGTLVA